MTFVETLRRQHLERQLRFMQAALNRREKVQPASYHIPNTPLGVPKLNPNPPVTEEWVERHKSMLPPTLPRDAKGYVRVEVIRRAVADHYDIRVHDMMSDRRTADLTLPRFVTFYLCRHLTLKSLPEIGRKMGGRDHSTILYGVRRLSEMLLNNERLQASIEMLTEQLGGEPE